MSNDPAPAAPADSWRIRIYCDDPVGNETDPPRTWIADLHVSETEIEGFRGSPAAASRRRTPRWVDSRTETFHRFNGHEQLRLPCIRCGRHDRYRLDRLHPFLLIAAQHGVAELSLRAIATTLPEQ